jgi:RNA polymerase sigma-70 factor (ECF subfamily)
VPDDLRQALTAVLPRLRRFALTVTGSAADSDDLVQNTCERALKYADQLREPARLDAWLYGIMRNLWVDEMRHRRVRRHDDIDAASSVIGEDGQATADGRITLDAVRRVMSQLPTDHRAVLMLVCVDGLTYKEAAEVLGIPVGTIMSRLSRARHDLHDRLTRPTKTDTVTPFPLRQADTPTPRDRARPA